MPPPPTTPSPLDAERLATLLAGSGPGPGSRWRVDVEDAAGSTNAVVAARAGRGEPEGTVLAVEHQTSGRGRLDRVWETPRGSALTFSVLLRPPVHPAAWPWLPLLAGVAVADGLAGVLGAGVAGLKWPNDVLVGDRKICGILVERVETTGGPAAVLGAGVNTGLTAAELPFPGATSVRAESGADPDRTALLAAVLSSLARRYTAWCGAGPHGTAGAAGAAGSGSLRADYVRSCRTLGRAVRVELPGGPPLTGTAEDVDDAGRLVVAHGPGPTGRTAVGAGDVVHVRAG